MATWADPRGDLRRFLADTTSDNFVKEKPVFGSVDASNRTYFTFDDRLIASGYQSAIPDVDQRLRVFINQSEIAASGVLVTNQQRGEFQLMYVPQLNDELRTAYHFQRSLDSDLDFDLQQAAQLVSATTADLVVAGMQAAVLHIAASFAHARLSQRWFQRKSDQFMLHDQPARDEADARVTFHREEAARLMENGRELRREYYDMRQDRGRAPAFALLKRIPPRIGPQR